ncbi:MAG: hypothetical protein ACJAYU_000627 [Bradymonadia bacterium]|jgi:hypothetical protein
MCARATTNAVWANNQSGVGTVYRHREAVTVANAKPASNRASRRHLHTKPGSKKVAGRDFHSHNYELLSRPASRPSRCTCRDASPAELFSPR